MWIVNHFKVCWDEISWVCRYVKWINKEICENWTAMNNNESTVIHVLQNKPLEIIVQNKKTSKNLLKWVTFIFSNSNILHRFNNILEMLMIISTLYLISFSARVNNKLIYTSIYSQVFPPLSAKRNCIL